MPTKEKERSRVYLNSVHLKGYKSIEDLAIDFKKGLNILIGKNGAGKSNFLDIINDAANFKRNGSISFNYAKLNFDLNREHSIAFELIKFGQAKPTRLDFDDDVEVDERLFIDDKVVYDSAADNSHASFSSFKFKEKKIIYRGNFRTLFPKLGYPFIHPSFVKFNLPNNLEYVDSPGAFKVDLDTLSYNWAYLNTMEFINEVLFKLEIFFDEQEDQQKKEYNSDILDLLEVQPNINENLRLYTAIEDIRFSKNINLYADKKSVIIDNIRVEFKINGNWLPWSQLSDGTKRLFYIISEVTSNNGLVFIEEPELGIHPHQFNLLMDFLKEQSEEKQIIISTHSPKALDHLSPDELGNILIAYYDLDKEEKKAKRYMKEVGFFSDYWMLSDLE